MQESIESGALNGPGRDHRPGPTRPSSYLPSALVGRACPEKGGSGVYACVDITAGSLLVIWGGRILTRGELEARPPTERRVTLQVDDDAYLVSDVEGPADWVNHCCEPNAGMNGQISLVALCDIHAGEEICFDYAMTDASDYDEFDCRCGARQCRGRVTGSDWMQEDVVERYAGYFSTYIERRVALYK
ncbi:MAG: SET domain-containing protein-lysine N-methyltransferase, partial [Myxococcales bacterium]